MRSVTCLCPNIGVALLSRLAPLLCFVIKLASDQAGNLTGATNAIDHADFDALVAKMGGRP